MDDRKRIQIMSLIVMLIGAILMFQGRNFVDNINFLTNEIDEKEELNIKSEIVLGIYTKIPKGEFDYKKFTYYSTYNSKKQTIDKLNDDFIINSALYNLDYDDFSPNYTADPEMQNQVYKLSKETMLEKINDIFGEIEFDIEKYAKDKILNLKFNALTSSQYIDGDFYFYEYFDSTKVLSSEVFNKLIKAEQEHDYIYLYDKYLRVVSSDEKPNEVFEIYYDEKTKSKETLTSDEFYNLESSLDNLEKLKNIKAYTYKHTFKKIDDDNYVWVSTEIFEK